MKPIITLTYTSPTGRKIGKNLELPVNDEAWAQSVLKSALGVVTQLIEARQEFEELEAERIANGG